MDFTSILSFAINLLIFLLGLYVLILVHELGHFLAAKRAGIKVEEFGLGFPPRVFKWKRGETVYSLNALPIGGFVRLYGEDEAVEKERGRSFYQQSKAVRTLVVVAGVLMNLLLGIVIFTVVYSQIGVPVQKEDKVVISYVFPGSPAQVSGLKPFDRILSVAGERIDSTQQVKEKTNTHIGQEIEYKVERSQILLLTDGIYDTGGRQEVVVRIVPRSQPPEGQGPVGIGMTTAPITTTRTFPWYLMPIKSAQAGIEQSLGFARNVISGLGGIFAKLALRGEVPRDLAGPVGIFQITSLAAQNGLLTLLSLWGILSLNLAVLNILPFPALDGGRLLFIVLEVVFRRRVFPTLERWAHTVGMVLLIALMLAITAGDLGRIFGGPV